VRVTNEVSQGHDELRLENWDDGFTLQSNDFFLLPAHSVAKAKRGITDKPNATEIPNNKSSLSFSLSLSKALNLKAKA
jgi:hypothetical protein